MNRISVFFLGSNLALVGWFVGFDWRIGFAIACLVPFDALAEVINKHLASSGKDD